MLVEHAVEGVDVILQIGIHTCGNVAALFEGGHETRQKCVLVTAVMGKPDAMEKRGIITVETFNDLPGMVLGPVVDKQDATGLRNHLRVNQGTHLAFQYGRGYGQLFLFAVAGNHQEQNRWLSHL